MNLVENYNRVQFFFTEDNILQGIHFSSSFEEPFIENEKKLRYQFYASGDGFMRFYPGTFSYPVACIALPSFVCSVHVVTGESPAQPLNFLYRLIRINTSVAFIAFGSLCALVVRCWFCASHRATQPLRPD